MSERRFTAEHTAGATKVTEEPREVGPCPACGGTLKIGEAIDPHTGKKAKALFHEMPFCHYYGSTDPRQIEEDMKKEMS